MSEQSIAQSGRDEHDDDAEAWAALAELYHRFLTGLLLALVTRAGTGPAAEVVFRTFRRQHLDAFLPGLEKLDLADQPHAVACAQYHVLSNTLGGVGVQWIPESDTKSWVRYLPPRWIFDGTAVCGIPTELSTAMLRGWHGHNGPTLGNDRLGFVCTKQMTEGQFGLEGYYIEEPEPLPDGQQVRFRPGEHPSGPPVDLGPPDWDPVRLAKVERNYSTAYIRTLLPTMAQVLGPATAGAIGHVAGRQIGMHYHRAVTEILDSDLDEDIDQGADDFDRAGRLAERMARLLAGHGTSAVRTAAVDGWEVAWEPRLFFGRQPASVFDAWNGLWEGLAEMEGVRLRVLARRDHGAPGDRWSIESAD